MITWMTWIAAVVGAAGAIESGSVSGRTTIPAGGILPEMVVYLEPTDPAQPVPAPPQELVIVSQRGAEFSPGLVVVSVGQSVEFRNDEVTPVEHNVFSRSPTKPFDLGLYPPNTQGKVVTFDKPGVVRLFCSIHRYMDGVVYVCPTPLFASVTDGAFMIENVPAGQWKLRTWQRSPRYNEVERTITIEADRSATVQLEMTR